MVEAARREMVAQPAVAVQDVFSATLADLLSILEKATSGETGVYASGAARLRTRLGGAARRCSGGSETGGARARQSHMAPFISLCSCNCTPPLPPSSSPTHKPAHSHSCLQSRACSLERCPTEEAAPRAASARQTCPPGRRVRWVVAPHLTPPPRRSNPASAPEALGSAQPAGGAVVRHGLAQSQWRPQRGAAARGGLGAELKPDGQRQGASARSLGGMQGRVDLALRMSKRWLHLCPC